MDIKDITIVEISKMNKKERENLIVESQKYIKLNNKQFKSKKELRDKMLKYIEHYKKIIAFRKKQKRFLKKRECN